MSPDTPVWYISGPMTGRPGHNFELFNRVEQALKLNGEKVLNPARHFDGDTTLDYATYIRADVEELMKCSDIMMLPGWGNSRGARLEYALAKALDLNIAYWEGASDTEPPETVAQSLVRNGERQATYGHPAIDFRRTAQIWSGITGADITAAQVALMMIGLKMSRLISTPGHQDSVIDLVGYAICLDRVHKYEAGDAEA